MYILEMLYLIKFLNELPSNVVNVTIFLLNVQCGISTFLLVFKKKTASSISLLIHVAWINLMSFDEYEP